MKKILIITGPSSSGKSLLTKLLFDKNHTFFIDGGLNLDKTFAFSTLPLNTKNLIIDDFSARKTILNHNINFILDLCSGEKLKIDRQCLPIEYIPLPAIVIVLDKECLLKLPPAIIRRSEVIDTDIFSINQLIKFCKERKIIINPTNIYESI